MLEQTGLGERAREPVGRLSGGNRQRVNVALGLIGDPPVLALDEPSASLDPGQRERLWEFLAARVAGGTTVLFSTHNVSEAQRYASRVLVLARGAAAVRRPSADAACIVPEQEQGDERDSGDLERALVRFLPSGNPGRPDRARDATPTPRGHAVRWLLRKDLLILRRSRLLLALLIVYPVAIALLIGLAISRSPVAPTRGDRR